MRADRPLRVGIRCDAGPTTGVGHLMRCVALAEEMVARGHEALFLADLGGVAFAERQLGCRGLRRVDAPQDPEAVLRAVGRHRLDAVVLDSYVLPPEVSAALVAERVPVLAVIDGPPRGQSAQLYLDQNIGAERDDVPLPGGARRLAGTSYALLRDAVRSLRPAQPWQPTGRPPQVVVAFGGTDAYGVTEAAVTAMVGSGLPFSATVVAPDPDVRTRLGHAAGKGQVVRAVPPLDDFPRLLAAADLVVGAAGTSAWEYSVLGRPAAVVAVVDNQHDSYGRLVGLGAVLGLGRLQELRGDPVRAQDRLGAALGDEQARAGAAQAAYALVDGDGRVRVVDALEDLVRGSTVTAGRTGRPGLGGPGQPEGPVGQAGEDG